MTEKTADPTKKVEVEFQQTYIAARGAGISGVAGAVKTFPLSADLVELLESGVVKAVKKGAAAKREKATTG